MNIVICINEEVARTFPETQIRLVAAYGIHNNNIWPNLEESLTELEKRIDSGAWCPFTKEDRRIASWHAAYRNFGTNPNRIQPSVYALSRRLAKSGRLPRISSAVDVYNFVSVQFGVAAGAFDLSTLGERVDIRFSRKGDLFIPLGKPDVEERLDPGEVVYADGQRVLTRHWNYRDSDITKITGESRDVIFILERVDKGAMSDEEMEDAQRALVELIRPNVDQIALSVIDSTTPVTYVAER